LIFEILIKMQVFILLLFGTVWSHMQFIYPYHRRSKYSPYYTKKGLVDWNGLDPLGNEISLTYPFPCKGHAKGPVQASYAAGVEIKINITGIAIHDGGHCQFGLTYNDKDIVVLKDVFTRCLLDGLNFSVKLPNTAPPSSNATLVWGWINALGNREWYMNCVDIEITGGDTNGKVTGPEMLIANLPGKVRFGEFIIEGPNLEKFKSRKTISISP